MIDPPTAGIPPLQGEREREDLARVDSVPGSAHGDLPHRATGDKSTAATYGKIPAEEFVTRSRAIAEEIARVIRNSEPTFREDYQIGIQGDVFTVDYHGKCQTCGFSVTCRKEQALEVGATVAAVDPVVGESTS